MLGPAGQCRIFDLLRGPQTTLLGFGAQWQPLIENTMAASHGRLRGYVIVDPPGESAHYLDRDGQAATAYARDTLFVVRPDNYIGMATCAVDAPGLFDYLKVIAP